MIQVHRLLDKVESAFFHRGYGFFDRSVSRHPASTGSVGSARLASRNTSKSGMSGEFQIGEDHQIAAAANLLDCSFSIGGLVDGITRALQSLAQHGAQLGLYLRQVG